MSKIAYEKIKEKYSGGNADKIPFRMFDDKEQDILILLKYIELLQKPMTDKAIDFLVNALLTNPETGERMEITKTEGAEKGHNCLVITVEGISGAYEHRIVSTES